MNNFIKTISAIAVALIISACSKKEENDIHKWTQLINYTEDGLKIALFVDENSIIIYKDKKRASIRSYGTLSSGQPFTSEALNEYDCENKKATNIQFYWNGNLIPMTHTKAVSVEQSNAPLYASWKFVCNQKSTWGEFISSVFSFN